MPPENTKLLRTKWFFETFLPAFNAGSITRMVTTAPTDEDSFRPVFETISALGACNREVRFTPQEPTSSAQPGMSETCQERTRALHQKSILIRRSTSRLVPRNRRGRFRLSRKLWAASGDLARRFGFRLRDVPTEATLDPFINRAYLAMGARVAISYYQLRVRRPNVSARLSECSRWLE
jgi:hypothetical protein